MNNKINFIENKLLIILFIVYCFCPIYITFGQEFPNHEKFFSLDIIFSIILFIVVFTKKINFQYSRVKIRLLEVIVFIHVIISTIYNIYYHYNILNIIYSCMPFLLYVYLNNKMVISRLTLKKIYWILNFSLAIAIILFFTIRLGAITITFDKGIDLSSTNAQLNTFGEKRLSWVYGHKVIAGSIFNILVIFNLAEMEYRKLYFRKKTVKVFLVFAIVGTILTNSMTSIMIMLLILGIHIIHIIGYSKKISIYIKLFIPIIILVFSFIVIFPFILQLSKVRDLTTGGSRFIIWRYVIENIKFNPLGFGYIPSYLDYGTSVLGFNVMSTHNTFLMYGIKEGLLPMISFTCLFCSIAIYNIKKYKYYMALVIFSIFFSFMIDMFWENYVIMMMLLVLVFSKYLSLERG